jgi:hypothetical protein
MKEIKLTLAVLDHEAQIPSKPVVIQIVAFDRFQHVPRGDRFGGFSSQVIASAAPSPRLQELFPGQQRQQAFQGLNVL